MVILQNIKEAIGVDENNLAFDEELLIYLNSVRLELYQHGLDWGSPITRTTEWPEFPPSLEGLIKHFFVLRIRMYFDPTSSDSINSILVSSIDQTVGRITHENEELNNE